MRIAKLYKFVGERLERREPDEEEVLLAWAIYVVPAVFLLLLVAWMLAVFAGYTLDVGPFRLLQDAFSALVGWVGG